MSGQRSLFDSGYESAPALAPSKIVEPLATDIVRTLQHKRGPFFHLVGGNVDRHYRVVELRDGSFVAEFTDNGERQPYGFNRNFVDAMVAQGEWIEAVI